MNKKEMDAMESELRVKLMKERWQKTAEQEMKYAIKIPVPDGGWLYVTETKEDGSRDIKTYNTHAEAQRDNTWVWNNKGEVVEHKEPKPVLPYASNKEIADEKIGKWLSSALEDPTTCGAMKDDINEWFRAIEEERLRTKKKSIHDELYDAVKMEMFRASSALEGIKPITDEEYELFEKLKKIWLHSVPEKSGTYFICGEVGDRDASGLPEKIMVCPAYGSDGFAIYTKTSDYSASSY